MTRCTVHTKECTEAALLPECCRLHLVETTREVGRLLTEARVPWWVDYGTLLGLARDGRIIAHDRDVDLGFFGKDWAKVHDVASRLRDLGYYPSHSRYKEDNPKQPWCGGDSLTVYRSKSNRNHVDLFPWYEQGEMCHRASYLDVDRYKGRAFPFTKLWPLQPLTWEGILVWAPKDLHWFVCHRYGDNWRTPLTSNNDGVVR